MQNIPTLSTHAKHGPSDPEQFLRSCTARLASTAKEILSFAERTAAEDATGPLFPTLPVVPLIIPMRASYEVETPDRYCVAGYTGHELLMKGLYEILSCRMKPQSTAGRNHNPGAIRNDVTTNYFPLDAVLAAFPDADHATGALNNSRYMVCVNEDEEVGKIPIPNDLKDMDVLVVDKEQRRIVVGDCKFSFSSRKYGYYRREYNNFKHGSDYQLKLKARVDWLASHLPEFDFVREGSTSGTWSVHGVLILNQFPVGRWLATGSLGNMAVAGSEHCNRILRGD
jgi:hypothetical protein